MTRLPFWDRPLQGRKLTVPHPLGTLLALFFILQRDSLGLVRLSLAAALWHESGHLLACRLLMGDWPPLTVQLTGFCLSAPPMDRRKDLWVTLAGPGANLLAGLLLLLTARLKAGYGRYFFACVHLGLGFFNLLPLPPLDGWRICRLLRDQIAF